MNVNFVRSGASRLRPGVEAGHEHYKWWVLSCTSLGMLLATINSGTLIIALPDLERSLGTTLLQLVWVILAYMIASTVLVLTAGRLSDVFGRKKAYVGGFLLFTAASLGSSSSGGSSRASAARCSSRTLRRWSPTPFHASSWAWRWARTRWSPPSDSSSALCSEGLSLRSPGTGSSGSTCRSGWPGLSGAGWSSTKCRPATPSEGSTCSAPSPSSLD